MGIFQRLNQERGITVVLITHEMDIAEHGTRHRRRSVTAGSSTDQMHHRRMPRSARRCRRRETSVAPAGVGRQARAA